MADLADQVASEKFEVTGDEKDLLSAVMQQANMMLYYYKASTQEKLKFVDPDHAAHMKEWFGSNFFDLLDILVDSLSKVLGPPVEIPEEESEEEKHIAYFEIIESSQKTILNACNNGALGKILDGLDGLKVALDDPSISNMDLYRGFVPSDPDSPDVSLFKALASSNATTPLLKFHAQSIIKRHEELAAKTAKATTGNKASKGKNKNKSS